MSTALIDTGYGKLLINGLVVSPENVSIASGLRKKYRSHRVASSELGRYTVSVAKGAQEASRQMRAEIASSVAPLHDIRTALTLLYRNVDDLIHHQTGQHIGFEERIADERLHRVAKSTLLLRMTLDMASIVNNPQAATVGQRRSVPMHRTCTWLVRVFEEHARAKGIELVVEGNSYREPRLYDSFKMIPIVLLDNAIKYGRSGTRVIVAVNDTISGCSVSIASYGRLVPPESRDSIFLRGVRGPDSELDHVGGTGIGLYLARVVADANGFLIDYVATASSDDPGVGWNTFRFHIAE